MTTIRSCSSTTLSTSKESEVILFFSCKGSCLTLKKDDVFLRREFSAVLTICSSLTCPMVTLPVLDYYYQTYIIIIGPARMTLKDEISQPQCWFPVGDSLFYEWTDRPYVTSALTVIEEVAKMDSGITVPNKNWKKDLMIFLCYISYFVYKSVTEFSAEITSIFIFAVLITVSCWMTIKARNIEEVLYWISYNTFPLWSCHTTVINWARFHCESSSPPWGTYYKGARTAR